jgi:S-(hydroxymethyl)glutathione dehydrogenase/alcohol dehydrogenase
MDDQANHTLDSARALSRREVLGSSVAVALAGGAASLSTESSAAGAPAIQTGTMSGRRYRALVYSPDEGSHLIDLRMLPLGPDHVVVRTEASFLSYDKSRQVLGPPAKGATGAATPPLVLGDGGVGIVEAVGERVRRVQVGDRVIVQDSPYCGTCYNCLRGRADRCQLGGGAPLAPVAQMADGRHVVQHNNGGGFAELLIAYEWYCHPIFSQVPSRDLAALVSEAACGLGMAFGVAPVEPGSSVCVIGCGPVGLAAVQGARIKGASQIIAVDPIASRRALALSLGATTALNPFDYFKKSDLQPISGGFAAQETDELVKMIRDLCKGPTNRPFAGGRFTNLNGNSDGPDYVIEATGPDLWVPASGPSPDPGGILPLQQAWKLNSTAGHLCTSSVGQAGSISIPAPLFANARKNHHPGNMNGVNTMRDMQRFATLTQTGQFNGRALVPESCSLDDLQQMYRTVAERRVAGAALLFAS